MPFMIAFILAGLALTFSIVFGLEWYASGHSNDRNWFLAGLTIFLLMSTWIWCSDNSLEITSHEYLLRNFNNRTYVIYDSGESEDLTRNKGILLSNPEDYKLIFTERRNCSLGICWWKDKNKEVVPLVGNEPDYSEDDPIHREPL